MRRKNQFVALSLAVALILGGALPTSNSLSRVHAEEAQTETFSGISTDAIKDLSSADPTTDQTVVPPADQVVPPADQQPTDQKESVSGNGTGALIGASGNKGDVSVVGTYSVPATYANGAMENGKVDYFKNTEWEAAVKAGTATYSGLSALENEQPKNYGNDAIQIYFTDDVDFKADANSGKGREINGYAYWYGVAFKTSGTAGDVKVENGAVVAKNAVQVTATQNGSISFAMYKSGNAGQDDRKIHFYCFEDGALKEYEGYGVLFTDHKVHTFNLEAGKTYYLWTEGFKGQIYDISYSYEKPKEMVTKTEKLDILQGLNKGDTYGKTGVIEIVPSNDFKNPGSKDYIQPYNDAGAAFNGKLEFNEDGTIKTKDGVLEIKALEDGCKITIDVKATSNKSMQFVHLENGTPSNYFPDKTDAVDEPYTFDLEKDVTYYFCINGTKYNLEGISISWQEESGSLPPVDLVEGTLAFPTAEGGGRLATGGRGGDVYIVDTLDDSGEGSLRYGIETAPDTGRIIVFSVGGTIKLESTLTFKNKQNITIAGQTAPGEGITVEGYDTNISDSKNIIIRFVRFRVGSRNLLKGGDSMDALWGRDNDTFIIDHCTFSWNTDETLSTYRGKNGTVQWCLISESLTVSGHSKGRHGYGGIFGGDNTVFQYNLMTNHTSRNPRIGGGTMTDPGTIEWDAYQAMTDAEKAEVEERIATLQLSNNVLYNHGYFACYGGGWTYTNYIYNYVKPGQGTRDALVNTLLGFGENKKLGGVYYTGNVLEKNAAVTADNSKGFSKDGGDFTEVRSTPYTAEAFEHITLDTTGAYVEQVLNSAGATFPRRDAIDARVVDQVANNTGTYINNPDEVGGYPMDTLVRSTEPDTDGDGIPDQWETDHKLDPNDPTDSRTLCLTDPTDKETYGYAWIEVYFNGLVKEQSKASYVAENPEVSIDLVDNTLIDEGKSVTVTATAASSKGIAKVEFYNGGTRVGTVETAPYTFTYTPEIIGTDGTYHISVRAYDNEGNQTQSDTSRLYVNSTAGIGEWSQTDIGTPEIKGTASLVDGVLTVKGAGKIGASEGSNKNVRPELANSADDDFHFVYQEMTGDIEIVTRFDSYVPVDNHTFQGLMFRSSLKDNAAMAALGFTMVKVDETTIWSAFMVNRNTDGGNVQNISETIDSPEAAAKAGIPLIANLPFKEGNDYLGTWLKLSREGDKFIGSVSSDGLVWQKVGELTVDLPDTAYVGFAVEANRAGNDLINYGSAKFSNIEVNESFAKITYDTENVKVAGADKLALGKDLAVTLSKVTGHVLPETVEVTIGGKPAVQGVDYTYDPETGIITIQNVQGDVTISAYGVKRVVLPVEYEEIDEGDLLTVTEEAGKLILTQVAETGNMQTTNKDTGVVKEASNVSYLLFPEVDEYHELSMNVTVKSVTAIGGKGDENGFFLGAFAADGSGIYTTFGFRANMVGKGYWYKPGGAAGSYTGDGNPGITTGSNTVYALDTTYNIVFKTDGKGGYNAVVTWPGGNITKQFKAGESAIATGDVIRYGMAIIGATVEISDLKLVDPENNVIYNQNSADYSKVIEAIEKASSLNPADYVDFSAVEAAWDAVNLGLDASHQAEVDAMAKAIMDAIEKLEKKPDLADYSAVDAAIEKAGKLNAADYENFDTVTAAIDAVQRGLTAKDQAKVDAMAKAIEDAIAGLKKKPGTPVDPGKPVDPSKPTEPSKPEDPSKPGTPETPDESQTVRVEVSDTIPDSALTEGVKEKTGCSTVSELTAYMQNTVVKEGFVSESSAVMDVTIMVSADGGKTWAPATKENMPKDGVDIILPYPQGTNKDDYDFTVSHLITQDWNGQVAGTVEWPAVTKTDEGLKMHVMSASPFAVAWKLVVKDNDSEDEESGENVSTKPVKTGDNMNVALIIWAIVLLAVVAGAGVLVYRRKHGSNGTKTE